MSNSQKYRKLIRERIPEPCRILDISDGFSPDLNEITESEHDIYLAVSQLSACQNILNLEPELEGKVFTSTLPDLALPDNLVGSFDAIICSTWHQAVTRENMFNSVYALKRLLKPRGKIMITFPTGSASEAVDNQESVSLHPDCIELLFEIPAQDPSDLLTELKASGSYRLPLHTLTRTEG